MNLFTTGIAMIEQHRINTQHTTYRDKEETPMDPYTIAEYGRIRQQEILDWAAKTRDHETTWIWQGALPLNRWRQFIGRSMVRIGSLLVDEPTAPSNVSTDIC